MQQNIALLIARHFVQNAFKSKAIYPIMAVVTIIFLFAAFTGWENYKTQNTIRHHYQKNVRQSWENNPDKHPHRMAHYGTFAFRLKHKLSMFDFGMESFVGNAIFLEAHKQNTINFSEAGFSTSLLRFGEISMAMLLQIILPLIIFFLGFAAVAEERENGTLKILLSQGASWKQILVGKSLGLMALAMLFFAPIAIITAILLCSDKDNPLTHDESIRYAATIAGYILFFQIISIAAVLISARSHTSKDALIKLLGVWLFFAILLPKTTQALGNYLYPAPSKIAFEAAVERDLIKEGDSHNPDDLHYKAIKDSLLHTYKVDSVQQLPFNYSGFIMKEGERISAAVYNRHLTDLLYTYQKQNRLAKLTAFFNPYAAIKNMSMACAGADFPAYIDFQNQAEDYRYQLAQHMNSLQMALISNEKPGKNDKPHSIGRHHWKEFPDFQYQFLPASVVLINEMPSIVALGGWSIATIVLVFIFSKKAKAV